MVYPVRVEELVKEFGIMHPDAPPSSAELLRATFEMANSAYQQGRIDEANQRKIRR